ncbi:DMT family transporter [Alteromonas oceanisediminis]|uniref:DMT family transporter n=1 Tax=Alteromonas oceanisediminis TaxID=2836180 RepID=UPI001BDAD36E|nr:EamA family transporter [Alteromonas oceanisediminis]MBT0587898.1 EamA family transporter [Alteromonas oceanisediminis]
MNAALFIACTLIWGSTWIAISFQIGEVEPVVAVAWRFSIAVVCLGLWCLLTRRPLRLPAHIHVKAALVGLFLYTLDYSFLYAAQQHIVSALLAVLSSSVIYFTVLFRRVLLEKPMRMEVIIGATLGLVGIICIFMPEFTKMSAQQGLALGLLWALISFTCAAIGNIISERILDEGTPVVQMNFYAMGYGLIFMYGFGLVSGASYTLPTEPDFYIALFYLAVFGSVLAFGSYMKLLQRIGSDKSTYVVLVYPIVALGISTLFEGYQWTAVAGIGVVIVLLGNAVAMGKLNVLFRSSQ